MIAQIDCVIPHPAYPTHLPHLTTDNILRARRGGGERSFFEVKRNV